MFELPNLPTICLLFCFIETPAPTAVNNYAQECRVLTLSRKDTPETQRLVSRENARCRTARGEKKK